MLTDNPYTVQGACEPRSIRLSNQ